MNQKILKIGAVGAAAVALVATAVAVTSQPAVAAPVVTVYKTPT
jgi:hypothetical protein